MKKRMLALACALSLSTFQPTKPNPAAIAWNAIQLTSGGFAAFMLAHLINRVKKEVTPWNESNREKLKGIAGMICIATLSYTAGAAGLNGLLNELAD